MYELYDPKRENSSQYFNKIFQQISQSPWGYKLKGQTNQKISSLKNIFFKCALVINHDTTQIFTSDCYLWTLIVVNISWKPHVKFYR